jgi:hypothetical protein
MGLCGRKWDFVDCNTTRGNFRSFFHISCQNFLTTKNVFIALLKTRLFFVLHFTYIFPMEKELLEFIKLNTPSVLEVLEYKVTDNDSSDGFIGEHYIVNCVLQNSMLRTCMVDISIFEKWVKKKNSVIWI